MKILYLIFLVFSILYSFGVSAEKTKIPRYVSTKFDESNVRIGASTDYPIKLTYTAVNFPLKIIDEHEVWRLIIDIDGNQGWMKKSLLRNKRYAIIKTSSYQKARIYNKPKGIVIGKIGNGNIVKLNKCFSLWCYIIFREHSGWINKINIWGVDKSENFNMPFYQFLVKLYWKMI